MRVLQIIHSRNFAGSERSVLTLAEALRTEGITVFLSTRSGGKLDSIIAEAGFTRAHPPLAWWRSSGGLRQFLERERIDLIHTHLTQAARLGLVLRHQTGSALVSHLRIQRRDPVFQKILQSGGHLIANSPQTATFYHSPEGGNLPTSEAFHTIPNATGIAADPDATIDRETARTALAAELNLPETTRFILLSGRVSPGKGHDLLLPAWSDLADTFPLHHIVLAGNLDQKPAFVRNLRQTAATPSLANRVHFLGFRSDVPRLVRAADVQVVPSRNEAFGLVVIEAMALGTPVLGSASGAIPAILDGGTYGSLFQPGDPASLAAALRTILSDLPTALRRAESARRHCLATYSPKTLADRTLEVYQRALTAPFHPCSD